MAEIIETGEVIFGEPIEVTVGDLVPGDFVVTIPAQSGVRGLRVSSGVKAISDPDLFGSSWGMSRGRGRRRLPVASRKITFLCGGTYEIPASFRVTARRRVQG